MTATTETTALDESAQQALAKARQDMEDAQDELTGLEQAAGRGEAVDAQALVIARAQFEIRATRHRALEAKAQVAAAEIARLEREQRYDSMVKEFETMERKLSTAESKYASAKKAYEAMKDEVRDLAAASHSKLKGLGLPLVDMAGNEDGEICHFIQRRGYTPRLEPMDHVGGMFRIRGRIYGRDGRDTTHSGNRGTGRG